MLAYMLNVALHQGKVSRLHSIHTQAAENSMWVHAWTTFDILQHHACHCKWQTTSSMQHGLKTCQKFYQADINGTCSKTL